MTRRRIIQEAIACALFLGALLGWAWLFCILTYGV